MFRLRGLGALGMLVLAAAFVAWAFFIFRAFDRAPFWPAATLAAAIFLLVAGLLYAGGHPDARIVGVFGLAIFAVANAVLCVSAVQDWQKDQDCVKDLTANGATETDAQIRCAADPPTGVTGDRVAWVIAGTAALSLLVGAILAFASPAKPPTPDAP